MRWHGKIRGGWKIIENILQKLVENSQNAIDDGIYDITETLPKSEIDLQESIKNNSHASLITEIKFSSPAEGDIRQISDPVQIAKSMISGGAQALSVLTQPHLFNGSPEYFIKIRKNVKIPLLMKDIMIDKTQIDAAKKMGAPPDIIDSAICSGSEIGLMSPSAGDENFISVIRDACLLFPIDFSKLIPDFGNVSAIS